MCGIAVWFSAHGVSQAEARAESRRLMGHVLGRGPDGSGNHITEDGRVGLVHARLAIIDPTPRSDQPMLDAATGSAISFNGEIYNYRELRADLIARGVSFESAGDTEVLLRGYLCEGLSFFSRLRGMYAFAIFDGRNRQLIALRDPLGIKPLYLCETEGKVVLASSPAAIQPAGDRRLDPAAAVSVAILGSVLEPLSPFLGVRQMAPGVAHVMRADGASVTVTRQAVEPAFDWTGGPSAGHRLERLRAALDASVQAHFTSDVPVAVFQSAGLDSTLISTLASHQGLRPTLLTIGFPEYRGTRQDEVAEAGALAAHLGLEHRSVYIDKTRFDDLREQFFSDMQTPTADGLNTYLAAWLCRQEGLKVALTGAGGDELFAGYASFKQLPRLNLLGALAGVRPARGLINTAFEMAWRADPGRSPKLKYFGDYLSDFGRRYLLRRAYFAPEELHDVLDADVVQVGLPGFWAAFEGLCRSSKSSDASGVRALEFDVYLRNVLLRDADWAGLAHGVEVRTPLVDIALYRSLCDQRDRCVFTKDDLRRLALQVDPALPLAHRRKTGFVVPHNAWSVAPDEVDTDLLKYGSKGPRAWNRQVLKQWFGDWAQTSSLP